MPSISITVPKDKLDQLTASLSEKQVKQALYQAVLRTTKKLERSVAEGVQEQAYINRKYIKRAVKSKRPQGTPPVGSVIITKQKLPLIAFRARGSKRNGVTVQLGPNLGSLRFKHAFITSVKSPAQDAQDSAGHRGVFMRTRKANDGRKLTKRGFAQRLAIRELFGPSVIDIVDIPSVTAKIEFDANAEMVKQLDSQLTRFLKTGTPPDTTEPTTVE